MLKLGNILKDIPYPEWANDFDLRLLAGERSSQRWLALRSEQDPLPP
jgi:hypothetical protein